VQPECRTWNLRQGKHSDIFRYITEELYIIAAQYTTSNKVTEFHLPLGSREVTPSSGREAPSDITVQSAWEGVKGAKRRCKQSPQGAMTTTNYDDDNNGKADGSDMGRVTTVALSDKRQARPPTDHFKRLLKEA
jgi:hypothetical protein